MSQSTGSSTEPLEGLEEELRALTEAFDEMVADISTKVGSLAQEATAASTAALETANDGVISRANDEIDKLKQLLVDFDRFQGQVVQLEQIKLITANLRTVVLDLEKQLAA